MIHRITIPDFRFVTLNEMNSAKHWGKRARLKQRDREFVWAYSKQQDTPQATGKRRVSLEITLRGRGQVTDPDALWKSCNDALVLCDMLVDDSAKWCELGTVTHVCGEECQTVIILEDLP